MSLNQLGFYTHLAELLHLDTGTNAIAKRTTAFISGWQTPLVIVTNAICHFEYYKTTNVKSIGPLTMLFNKNDYRFLSHAYISQFDSKFIATDLTIVN